MPENRLLKFGVTEVGEQVTHLHKRVAQECEKKNRATAEAIDQPERLMARNRELEAQVHDMIEAERERERQSSLNNASSHAERAALKQLAESQAECEAKDSEMRRMRIALEAARDELQKLSNEKTDLRRELEQERSELHKLRQEKRTTVLPHQVNDDRPRHNSPRQLEHPELNSPRQYQRRAQSASASRPSTATPQRPFSARPSGINAQRPASAQALARGPAMAVSLVAPRETAEKAGSSSGTPRQDAFGAAPGTAALASPREAAERAMARMHATYAQGSSRGPGAIPPKPGYRDGGAQTQKDLSDAHWERQVKELQRANARLQTALLAAALDPDGGSELGTLLAAVDRGLGKRTGQQMALSPRQPRSPSSPKEWPFGAHSSLPTGSKLPKGFTQPQWPSMA